MIKSTNRNFINKMIKKYPVETLHINGRLKNESAEYFEDDSKNPEVAIIKHDGWLAPFSENIDKMMDVLNEFGKDDEVMFCGLPLGIANPIIEGLNGFKMKWVERCVLYYLPETEYKRYLNLDENLDEIKKEDISVVYDHYTYKDEDSEAYLLECVNNGPSSIIKNEKQEAISWALLREDGSLGVMYTLEEYRKQGMAIKISRDLIKKVVKKGFQPYAHIVVENQPSRKLAEQLGMVLFDEILWFGMERI